MSQNSSLKESKILIVDDDNLMRSFLNSIFKREGFTNISEATNGLEALEKTLELKPDIVFLDINMPEMTGLEYCVKIRANEEFNNMAILVQTILSDAEEKRSIFDAGATDYICKPIDEYEIIARSILHLNNAYHLKHLQEFNSRVKLELQSAKRLVDISLPNETTIQDIKKHTGIDMYSYFQTSFEMGGDFWGTHKIDENRVGIYLVDFSGHGVDAALNATRLDCLIKSSPEKTHNPAKLLEWLNSNLYALLPPEQYATMFYGVIDIKNNTLSYASAACPDVYIFRNGKPEIIYGDGYPLGTIKDATYANATAIFNKEDVLFLYSDALIETENKEGNFLSDVKEYFLKGYKGSKPALLRECFDMLTYNFMNEFGDNMHDDLTIVMCCRTEN